MHYIENYLTLDKEILTKLGGGNLVYFGIKRGKSGGFSGLYPKFG